MEKFNDQTDLGNERALKKGTVVPDGAVNLAWTKTPQLTPKDNMVIIDTSRAIEENVPDGAWECKLFTANALGILENEDGDPIQQEFPNIADVFNVDEDFSEVNGNEYTDAAILPFRHVSRYFHLDKAGMSLGSMSKRVDLDYIKVVDDKGREYVDENGRKLYRVEIIPVDVNSTDSEWAYRVHVYIDVMNTKDLYLLYNKIEIVDGNIFDRQNINHKERLNPQPYFEYRPEESEVVEPSNRKKKIYSSKPANFKDQALGGFTVAPDSWDIYVPRKALPDPRQFQLFRWRVACDFIENTQVDPFEIRTINVGVVTTNSMPTSPTPYVFYNMENSGWNATNVKFRNPLYEAENQNVSALDKKTAEYWQVNLDNIEYKDLEKFDILVWSIKNNDTSLLAYRHMINYFTNILGGTVLIETNNLVGGVTGMGFTVSAPVEALNGTAVGPGALIRVRGGTIEPYDETHPIINGNEELGGWYLDAEELNSISDYKYKPTSYFQNGGSYLQCINSFPSDWDTLFQGTDTLNNSRAVAVIKTTPTGGNIIVSTCGIAAHVVNTLRSSTSNAFLSYNNEVTAWDSPTGSVYPGVWNYAGREGGYKAFFNMCLLATKGKILDEKDQYAYSTVWTAVSQWHSSWVIDGTKLASYERDENDFIYQPMDPSSPDSVWQRRLSNMTLQQLIENNMPVNDRNRIKSASTKTYRIEVTNSNVEVPTTLDDNTFPMAWTEAYSPEFAVPADFGPHIVVEDKITPEFDAGQYVYRSYPAKPYKLQVRSNYSQTAEIDVTKSATIEVVGTATETTITREPTYTVNTKVTWATHGDNTYYASPHLPDFGAPRARGIATYSQENYNSANVWGFYGFFHVMQRGSTGQFVVFLQHFLNRLRDFGGFGSSEGRLAQDGIFGSKTQQVLTNFQQTFNLRATPGVVDAETYAAIGAQIIRFGADAYIKPRSSAFPLPPGEWTGIYDWPGIMMSRNQISDDLSFSGFAVSSNNVNGPQIVTDAFSVKFPDSYNFHTISIIPYVPTFGNTSLYLDAIDIWGDNDSNVETIRGHMSGWNPANARFPIHQWMQDSVTYNFKVGPFNGNTITAVLSQSNGPNINNSTARVIGVREIAGWAETVRGGQTVTKTETIEITASIPVSAINATKAYKVEPNYTGSGTLSDIRWIELSNVDEHTFIEPGFVDAGTLDGVYIRLRNRPAEIEVRHGDVVTAGAAATSIANHIPFKNDAYYSMDENKVRSSLPETGFISKKDGIKLLCTSDKKPFGFPSMPTGVGPNERQRHYVMLSIDRLGTDPSVKIGFYDINAKEFIVDRTGVPNMTYMDYMERGPQNVYVGIISDYQEDTTYPLPSTNDAPKIPFRWAKPIYGVCYKKQTKIGIEPLPDNLGPRDMWHVPIRIGKFIAPVVVPDRGQQPVANWTRDYFGQTLKGFYSIPEAEKGGWSLVYGRPNYDIVGEHPLILGDNVIQVRQPPILMVGEPTPIPSSADPVKPVFKIYTRATTESQWEELNMGDVIDYNVHSGEIFLRNALATLDANLIKIDYTTPNKTYAFKGYDGNRLNLNPYPGYDRSLIGKPIYIYIVPEYVTDNEGIIISDSVNESTLRYSLEPNVFDPLRPEYDPSALQLGVIYITTALDIQELILIDTRRRGGGASDSLLMNEIKRMVSEASSYWDIGYGAGMSYQHGGFVVIRLPRAIKDEFPNENDIIEAIERNISAGVEYIIEDSEGNSW